MLQKLLDILSFQSNGKEEPFDFPSLDFERVDLDEMAEKLRLEEKAASNGENEIPASDATQLDGPQEEIKAHIKGRVSTVMTGYERRVKGLNNEIRSCRIEDKIDRLEAVGEDLGQELRDLESRLGPKIEEARASLENARKDLRTYRDEHGIEREPDYPESRTFQVGLLLSVCILEALVNGFFFRQGMQEGLIGGVFLALILAAVDVVVVFFSARYSVWAYYGLEPVHKAVGALATIFALGWAILYNLLTAHIREYLQADLLMREATQQALDRFLSSPFGIEQADSLVLIILGIAFSISAYYAGAIWDEMIPYYGRKHRKLKKRKSEFEYWKETYREEAARLRDEKVEAVEETLNEAEEKTKRLTELIDVKNVLRRNVEECIRHHRSAFQALAKRYRDINQKHRSTSPPDYFDERPEIQFTDVKNYRTDEEEEVLENQKREVEEKKGEVMSIKNSIREEYERELTEIEGSNGAILS